MPLEESKQDELAILRASLAQWSLMENTGLDKSTAFYATPDPTLLTIDHYFKDWQCSACFLCIFGCKKCKMIINWTKKPIDQKNPGICLSHGSPYRDFVNNGYDTNPKDRLQYIRQVRNLIAETYFQRLHLYTYLESNICTDHKLDFTDKANCLGYANPMIAIYDLHENKHLSSTVISHMLGGSRTWGNKMLLRMGIKPHAKGGHHPRKDTINAQTETN
jgi:hypothetical protein